jgi:RNA polymerase-associated protein CTR9
VNDGVSTQPKHHTWQYSCSVMHEQVWVNLGSLHLARGEATDASRMYTAALSRFFGNKDPKVSVWLARAYYDAKDNKSCKRALLKAIHLFPDDQALYFNLAVTMQHAANTVRFNC